MAEKDQNIPQPTALDEVNRDNQELKDKVTLSQKYIMWGMIALSAIAVIVLVYIFAVRNPGIKSADEAVGQADFTLAQGNDSLASWHSTSRLPTNTATTPATAPPSWPLPPLRGRANTSRLLTS